MSLIKSISNDMKSAPTGSRKDILKTLYSECYSINKEDTKDDDVVKVLKKFISGAEETLSHLKAADGSADRIAKVEAELEIYNQYLPRQLGEDDLRKIVGDFVTGLPSVPTNIGPIMGMLKANHPGRYDGGMASKIANEMIKCRP